MDRIGGWRWCGGEAVKTASRDGRTGGVEKRSGRDCGDCGRGRDWREKWYGFRAGSGRNCSGAAGGTFDVKN